jgi:hypothetical protein
VLDVLIGCLCRCSEYAHPLGGVSREAVAGGTIRIAKEGTSTNLSDLFTKLLPAVRKDELLDLFTY